MSKKIYYYDEDYFKIIDTEEKAYFLGLLYADGYVNDKLGYAELLLKDNDVEILNKFIISVKSNRKIVSVKKKTGIYARVTINSSKIVDDLIQLGCTNNKTHSLKFPNNIPDKLLHHMIRGYFDGDGCIYTTKTKKYYGIQFDGNSDFLLGIENFFIEKINVIKKLKLGKRHKDRIDNINVLKYGGNGICLKIYKLLYENASVFLERKKNRFIECENIKENNKNSNNVSIEYLGIIYEGYNLKLIYDIIEKETGLLRSKISSRLNTNWSVYDIIKFGKSDKSKKSISMLDLNGNLISIFNSLNEAARKTGYNADSISRNAYKNRKYKNYKWKFN